MRRMYYSPVIELEAVMTEDVMEISYIETGTDTNDPILGEDDFT